MENAERVSIACNLLEKTQQDDDRIFPPLRSSEAADHPPPVKSQSCSKVPAFFHRGISGSNRSERAAGFLSHHHGPLNPGTKNSIQDQHRPRKLTFRHEFWGTKLTLASETNPLQLTLHPAVEMPSTRSQMITLTIGTVTYCPHGHRLRI